MKVINKKTLLPITVALVLIAVLAFWVNDAAAYERYKDPGSGAGNCSTCHGDFTGPVSPGGNTFPGDDKHQMHRSSQSMNAECDLCHTSGDGRNPFIGSSNGTGNNPGHGCVGCHGREADAGNDGISPGRGAGLRQHHDNAGVSACRNCHTDANPANYTPVGEDVFPTYYGTVDTDADEPCNPLAQADINENWTIDDFFGLDNDGDMLYDLSDPDCAPNQAPVAVDDAYTTDEDTPLNVPAPGVLGNDSDPDGDPLTAVLETDPVNGNLTLNPDGSFDYTPDLNYFGADSFTYHANDGVLDSNTATVTITVNTVNDPPVADANGPYIGLVGQPVQFDGSGSFDIDGTIVAYDWDFGDSNTGTGVNPTHIYTADGIYDVTLTVTDNEGATDTDITTASIGAVNQPPVAVDDAYTTDEDTPLNVPAPGVLGNDSDPDGDPLTAVLDTLPGNGSLTLNPDGSFDYNPDPNYFGTDSFTYHANDGVLDSNIATVTITINPVNDPPVADANGPYTGLVGQPVQFDGSGSYGIDGPIVAYDWDFGDSNTGTGVNPTHTYAAEGTYTVVLTVTDSEGDTGSDTTTATISAVPPPSAGAGPHGGYTPTTDACAGCHRAHTAIGPKLLKEETIVGLCFSCHGSSATGADTNVEDGLYLERDGILEVPEEGMVNWGLKGGGFVNAWMNTDFSPTPPTGVLSVTTQHTFDGSIVTAWGNGAIGSGPGTDIPLDCINCHNPHGDAGTDGNPTYRLLRPIPRESGAVTGVDVPDETPKFYTIGSPTGLYWGQSYFPIGDELAQWCAQCHTRYLASGAGDPEITDSGDPIFAYRHRSDGVAGPVCVSCHVAHGTSASMGVFSGSVPFPDGTLAAMDDMRSSLLRLDSRGICFECHGTPD